MEDRNKIRIMPTKYAEYIYSDKWREKRNHIKAIRGNRCEECGIKLGDYFQVHHKTYERFGNELDEDLELVCYSCHKRLEQQKEIRNKKRIIYAKRKKVLVKPYHYIV